MISGYRHPKSRRGSALIYATLCGVVIVGVMSLTFEFGQVGVAKSQLEYAIDAAAQYGVAGLGDGTYKTKAKAAAAENKVNGVAVTLVDAQITSGVYSAATSTFTTTATSPNAIRIRCDKVTNPLQLNLGFAALLGMPRVTLSAETFATTDGSASGTLGGKFNGFVGANYLNTNAALAIRGWDSATGTNTDPNVAWVAAQTSGSPNLNNSNIQGELQAGGTVTQNGSTILKGVKPLSNYGPFPTPTLPGTYTSMGNYNGPSGSSQTFAGGVYKFDTFFVPSGKTVTFSGPTTIYLNGSANISGALNTFGNLPKNLKILNMTGSGVDIGSNSTSPIYAEIYSPNGPMNLNARTFYGNIVASGVNVNGAFGMYVDGRGSYAGATTTSGGGGSMLVRPKTVN